MHRCKECPAQASNLRTAQKQRPSTYSVAFTFTSTGRCSTKTVELPRASVPRQRLSISGRVQGVSKACPRRVQGVSKACPRRVQAH